MKYKMIVSDFDGTIFSHNTMSVPAVVKDAITRYVDSGGKFVLCSGRMYLSIKKYAKEMGLTGELLCLQGSVCCSLDDDRELFVHDIPFDVTVKLLRFFEERNWTFQFYHDLRFFTAKPNPYTEAYEKLTDVKVTYVDGKVSEFAQKNGYSAHKTIVMTTPESADDKITEIKSAFPELDVTQSSPIFIEIVDKNSGKGNGVKELCKRLGVDLEQVVVMGDETNDLSMLLDCGLACAPSNAVDRVKAVADVIYPDVDEGGASFVINGVIDGTL